MQGERGGEEVESALAGGVMSAVNWSEVVQKARAHSVSVEGLREEVEALGVVIEPFDAADAERAAQLWTKTRLLGLSLADRACLALASRLSATVYTADDAWLRVHIPGVSVRAIRPRA